jgi:hypothetical protein
MDCADHGPVISENSNEQVQRKQHQYQLFKRFYCSLLHELAHKIQLHASTVFLKLSGAADPLTVILDSVEPSLSKFWYPSPKSCLIF